MGITAYGVGDPVTADSLNTYSPLGVIRRGRRTSVTGSITAETGVLRLDNIPVVVNHLYRIATSNINMDSSVANDVLTARIRVDATGASATTASTQIANIRQVSANINYSVIYPENAYYLASATGTISVLLSALREAGSGSLVVFCTTTDILDMVVSDMGIDPGDTGVVI